MTLPKRSEVPAELTWNLETIFETTDAWEKAFTWVTDEQSKLTAYEGKLGTSAQTLYDALQLDNDISQVLGKLFAYASMRSDEDTSNSVNLARISRTTTLASKVAAASAFMTPEILDIPQERVESFLREDTRLEL